ncbi:hypothetical protein PG995_014483 [Apiospora arundinis]
MLADEAADAVNPYISPSPKQGKANSLQHSICTPPRHHIDENDREASVTSTEMRNSHDHNADMEYNHNEQARRLAEQHGDEIAANSKLMEMIVKDYTESLRKRKQSRYSRDAKTEKQTA